MGVGEPRQGRRGVQGNQGNQGDEGEQGGRGATGAQGVRGQKGDPGDGLSQWMEDHPGTVLYIAIMATVSVVLQIVQVASW